MPIDSRHSSHKRFVTFTETATTMDGLRTLLENDIWNVVESYLYYDPWHDEDVENDDYVMTNDDRLQMETVVSSDLVPSSSTTVPSSFMEERSPRQEVRAADQQSILPREQYNESSHVLKFMFKSQATTYTGYSPDRMQERKPTPHRNAVPDREVDSEHRERMNDDVPPPKQERKPSVLLLKSASPNGRDDQGTQNIGNGTVESKHGSGDEGSSDGRSTVLKGMKRAIIGRSRFLRRQRLGRNTIQSR
jgi:hypothetical protein